MRKKIYAEKNICGKKYMRKKIYAEKNIWGKKDEMLQGIAFAF
jgi:hypothetical protein